MEQLRRAVARVGAQNALLAAQLAAREPMPPSQAAASAVAHDASDAPNSDLPGRAGAALPADASAAAGSEALAAPGSVLPDSKVTRAQHRGYASQEQFVAGSTFPPEVFGDAGALARRGAVVAQDSSIGDTNPLAGPEGVAAALARRVAALAAERRVLKALARLSLAITTDLLTGAHASGLYRNCRSNAVLKLSSFRDMGCKWACALASTMCQNSCITNGSLHGKCWVYT